MKKISVLSSLLLVAFTVVPAARGESARRSFSESHVGVKSSPPGFVPLRFMGETGVPLPAGYQAGSPVASAESPAGVPVIYGTVISSKAGEDGSPAHSKGMYTFTGDGTFTRLNTQGNAQYGGAPMADGFYYAVNRTGTAKIYVDKFNTSTWKRSSHTLVSNVGIMASDVAYDPTSDMVYGCFYNDSGDGYVFGKADYSTRKRTAIKPLEMSLNAVMADASGQIWAIDMTGNLLKIDKRSGASTTVGHTGVTPLYASSATIDLATGRCFWTVNPADGKGYLYEVDLTSGAATLVCRFVNSDEVTGIYVPYSSPQAAPAAVKNMQVAAEGGSLETTVSFTAPSVTSGGSDLEGSLRYCLWVDGEIYKEDVASPGDKVSVPVTVRSAGRTSYAVSFSNGAGHGARAYRKVFVGNDTPSAPRPSVTYSDGAFTVSWNRVSGSVNGGYVDPSRVVYTVVRQPDNVTVATETADTLIVDRVKPTPGRMIAYRYSVRATFSGNTGSAGVSAVYPLGEIATPWYEGFDSSQSMDNFVILASNGDGVKGEYSNGMSSAYITNSKSKHDDWLISAAIRMEAGVKYKLTFEAMASFNPERFEVRMGREATADSMTMQLVAPTDLQPDFSMNPVVPEFTVPESGLYHIGWHAISDPDGFYLYLDNISLTDDQPHESEAVDVPYSQDFAESSVLSDFTVADANKDGFVWNIDKGEARVANGPTGMDDWLITRPLRMYAGNRYCISIDASSPMNTKERLRISAGLKPVPESMTTEIIPATEVSTSAPVRLSEYFLPQADGEYFIGIHGCSAGGYELHVDNLSVAAPVTGMSPAAPTEVTLTPAPKGELKGTLRFKAPAVNVDGDPVGALDRIDVIYCDSVVHSFTSPAAGETLEYVASVASAGVHTFTVVASNYYSSGIPAEVSGYIGINIPGLPTDVKVTEDGDSGKVTVSWNAPAEDVDGQPLDPADVKYILAEVINGQQLVIARDIAETSYTLQAVAPGAEQQFKTYAVFPFTEAGRGAGVSSQTLPVGKAYTLPYKESFAGGAVSSAIVGVQITPSVKWSLYNDSMGDVRSADSDNGFAAMEGENLKASGAMFTGKIDLSGSEHPWLTFMTYNLSGEYPHDNQIIVQAMLPDGDVATLADFTISDRFGREPGWCPVEVDLTRYAGRTVRLAIGAVTNGYMHTLLDCLEVAEKETESADAVDFDGGISVSAGRGSILISGAGGELVVVSDMHGRVVGRLTGTGSDEVPVCGGVYAVRVGGLTFKILVM